MKRASSLLVGLMLSAGAMYAQEKKDTIPNVSNGSQPVSVQDTTRGLLKDTMPKWRRDTVSWHKDSLKTKWKDTLNTANNTVTQPLQDTGIAADANKVKDTLNTVNNGATKPVQDTGIAAADAGKWKDNSDSKTKRNEADTTPVVKTKKQVKDRVMMKEGEMVVIKAGKETKMVKSIKLPDGNIVMTDGTVKMPDGNSVKLKDGEYINLKPGKGK